MIPRVSFNVSNLLLFFILFTSYAFSSEKSNWGTSYQILPKLLISGHSVAENSEQLRHLGITHILNVTADNPPLAEIVEKHDVLHLALEDEPNVDLTDSFLEAYKFISNAIQENPKGKILVHCSAGQSRSASMVLYYLMRKKYWSLDEALRYSRSIKPNISPNYGFMKQLINQEIAMRGVSSVNLEKYMISQLKEVFSWIDDDTILTALEESSWNIQQVAQRLLDY